MAKKKGKKSARGQWEKLAAAYGLPAAAKPRKSVLRRLGVRGWLGSVEAEQFLLGALLGGGAAYVLGDEEKRERLMQGMVRLYTSVMGSVEEFREQLADIQAEVAAEQAGQAPLQ